MREGGEGLGRVERRGEVWAAMMGKEGKVRVALREKGKVWVALSKKRKVCVVVWCVFEGEREVLES